MKVLENPMALTGQRILVTGASSGIGRACAIKASRLGARVALVSRRQEALDETLSLMSGEGHSITVADLSVETEIESLFRVVTETGKLTGFVHAAGVLTVMPVQMISAKQMHETMAINFFAFLTAMKFFSKKKYCEGGSAVAISSVSSLAGWPGAALYAATKGAVDSAVRALAVELAGRGIRVNSVVPSNIRTPMFTALAAEMSDASGLEKLIEKQPIGLGESEDVANAVAFLLSSAARFITGSHLVVDGGYLAQ